MNNLILISITLLLIVTSCDGNIDDDPVFNTTILELRTNPETIKTNSQVEFEVIISDSLNKDNYEFTWVIANSEVRTTTTAKTVWDTPNNPGEYDLLVHVIDQDPLSSDPFKEYLITIFD
ncbi:MAG: hypothetical protein NXI08_01450 [bacterium]|nr:hypothetical protein [bacterium]